MTHQPNTPRPDGRPDGRPAERPAEHAPDAATAAADRALAGRIVCTGDMIAALIGGGLLETAGTPTKLPRYLWPQLDPNLVQEIWDAGAAAGYYAGRAQSRSRWEPEKLAEVAAALEEAGWRAMGRVVQRAVDACPPRPRQAPDDEPDRPGEGTSGPGDRTAGGRQS